MSNKLSISICISYLLSISTYFWSQSRYPQLGEKSGSTPMPDFLAFETILPHVYGESIVHNIFISSINWGYTNWKGMLFGILFAIGLLSLLHFINIEKFPKNRFVLAFIGFLNGVGLGVCANCSTPIGKSLIASGLHPIVAVNTIISSPSFNVIGIGMLFTLFPWYIALTKIIFYIIIVFVVVPTIFGTNNSIKTIQENTKKCAIKKMQKQSLISELKQLIKIFFKNATFIFKKTVPLMLLGGLIGISVMVLMPQEILNSLVVKPSHIIITGIIAFMLPVPMLFDIIFPALVYNSSVPSIFAIILLLNLGGFSIYPFLVLKQNIKIKKLLIFSIIFIILSVTVAYSAYQFKGYSEEIDSETLSAEAVDSENKSNQRGFYAYETNDREYEDISYIRDLSAGEIERIFQPTDKTSVEKQNKLPEQKKLTESNFQSQNLNIKKLELHKKQGASSFKMMYGEELGITDAGYRLSLMFSGVGVTDYNNDHRQDIILGSANGIKIYKNIGGSFEIDASVQLGELLSTTEVSQANFYDLDGDSWKDLFVATRTRGIFILWNNNGNISIDDSLNFDVSKDENHNYGISFGDVFDNGTVDIFLGEGTFLTSKNLGNFLIQNNGNRDLEITELQTEISGSTLSGLIWDFDNDGSQDIYEGNDFGGDVIYGIDNGVITIKENQKRILPISAISNMGLAIGDINNDLLPEFFISGRNEELQVSDENERLASNCSFINNEKIRKRCEIKEIAALGAITKDCVSIQNPYLENLCTKMVEIFSVHSLDNKDRKSKICSSIKNDYHFQAIYEYCISFIGVNTNDVHYGNIPEKNENVFIQTSPNGERYLIFPNDSIENGWSWGSFFEDIDNNGFQDLYIANGYIRNREAAISNKLYLNKNGKLNEQSDSVGLSNYLDTLVAATIDFDNDGDIDIINRTVFGELVIFENKIASGSNFIEFRLEDQNSSNTQSIGAKIILEDINGNTMIRNIYVGGHFMSLQDSLIHFGLGKVNEIESVTIVWPNGSSNILKDEFLLNNRYIITK